MCLASRLFGRHVSRCANDPTIHGHCDFACVTPGQTLLVGDTVYDMEMAVAAGIRAIGAAWGYHEAHELLAAGAYRVLTRIGELPNAIGEWE